MKIKLIKKLATALLSGTLVAVLATSLPMFNTTAYAGDVKVQGNASGLEIQTSGEKLFNPAGMFPGDSQSGTITLNNTDIYDMPVKMDVTATESGAIGERLIDVMELKIEYRGGILFDGKVSSLGTGASYTLGSILKGTSDTLKFTASLPGSVTSEFEDLAFDFKVVLIVNGDRPTEPEPPETEDPGTGIIKEPSKPEPPVTIIDNEVPQGQASPEPTIEPTEEPVATEEPVVVIDDAEVPQGPVTIVEEVVPLGEVKVMPKTGETSLLVYLGIGTAVIAFGVLLLVPSKKKEESK